MTSGPTPSRHLRAERPGLRAWVWTLWLFAAVGSCSRAHSSASDVRIETAVLPTPPTVGQATVDVTLSDAAGQPVRAVRVSVEGTMTHPGMAPSLATAQEVAPGHYRAALELTMAGDWIVIVEATLANNRRVERTFPLPSVQAR